MRSYKINLEVFSTQVVFKARKENGFPREEVEVEERRDPHLSLDVLKTFKN